MRGAIKLAGKLLSEAELRGLLSAGQYNEIVERLRQVAQQGNVLSLNGPKQGDLDILQQGTLDLPPTDSRVAYPPQAPVSTESSIATVSDY